MHSSPSSLREGRSSAQTYKLINRKIFYGKILKVNLKRLDFVVTLPWEKSEGNNDVFFFKGGGVQSDFPGLSFPPILFPFLCLIHSVSLFVPFILFVAFLIVVVFMSLYILFFLFCVTGEVVCFPSLFFFSLSLLFAF